MFRVALGSDSPSSDVTVFSSSKVFNWKILVKNRNGRVFEDGESQPSFENQCE
jgi:hypothetical protein